MQQVRPNQTKEHQVEVNLCARRKDVPVMCPVFDRLPSKHGVGRERILRTKRIRPKTHGSTEALTCTFPHLVHVGFGF